MGKSSRDKGAREERRAVAFLQSHGLVAARVAGSGAFASRTTSPRMREALTGDVVVECDRGDLRIEVKARASLPAYLVGQLVMRDDVTIVPDWCGAQIVRDYMRFGVVEARPASIPQINRATPAYLRNWLAQSPDGVVMMREVRKGRSGDWIFAFTPEGLARLTRGEDR